MENPLKDCLTIQVSEENVNSPDFDLLNYVNKKIKEAWFKKAFMATEEKGTYFSVKGKSYKFIGGDYDMQLKACEECALKNLCDQFIDDYAMSVCQTVGADKIVAKGNFQPTPEDELERMREDIENIIKN